MIQLIKQNIPDKLKLPIKKVLFQRYLSKEIKEKHIKYGKCIIFIATPSHGNLGDHAIVYSQYKMFESLGMSDKIVEIKSEDYSLFSDYIYSQVRSNDIIVIDGGGNMGTLWIHEEHKMRDIVNRFKNNKIIIFPETVFYSEDDFGKSEFEKSKLIYCNHNNLHICVRDKRSYELIKNEYKPANIKYVPDIVLYLNELEFENNREGAILCIREDKEKVTDDKLKIRIEKQLMLRGLDVKYSSTVINQYITKRDREKELYKKWKEFASAEIVITDRLHGMIFSAITGTPCIALNNSNGKVQGVYEWIKELPYIIFCEDIKDLETYIDELINLGISSYDNEFLMESFGEIKEIIKE